MLRMSLLHYVSCMGTFEYLTDHCPSVKKTQNTL